MDKYKSWLFLLISLSVFVFGLQGFVEATNTGKGLIVGYVYEMDGTTPIAGAVVKVKNVSTGSEYESSVSDISGVFNIVGMEGGVYQYTVITPKGDFVADEMFGVNMNGSETAKIAINVASYENKVDAAIANMPAPKEIEGETFIGRIIDFDANTKLAEIFVMQGALEIDAKMHALGEQTDFYQKVTSIGVGEYEALRVSPGQTATVPLNYEAQAGDAVYIAQAGKSLLPFLLAPVGVAAVVAGSSTIAYNMGSARINEECIPCSPFNTGTSSISKRRKSIR